jgi:hypothetical protein
MLPPLRNSSFASGGDLRFAPDGRTSNASKLRMDGLAVTSAFPRSGHVIRGCTRGGAAHTPIAAQLAGDCWFPCGHLAPDASERLLEWDRRLPAGEGPK